MTTTARRGEEISAADEVRQEDDESSDIDSEPIGGYFDLLESEEEEHFPFTMRTFSINFLNQQLNYSLLNPTNGGCAPETKLFAFVPTRPDAFYRRQKIRESWASNLTHPNITLKFIVGWPQEMDIFELLLEELSQLNDLILYDIEDTYANLYLKVHVAFQWQQAYCPNVEFVLKTDDDTVVDFGRLQWWIEREFARRTRQHPVAVFGGLWRGAKPIRSPNHKWYVPAHLYPPTQYPPYMNGPTYLLTNQAVSAILNATKGVRAIPIEDILYTGILAERAHVHKFSIWRHIRQGKNIHVPERCKVDRDNRHGVPFVTALYGISDPEKLQKTHQELRQVDCVPDAKWPAFLSSLFVFSPH